MEIDKLALIFIKNRKALGAVSKGKDVFYFPGGKRESGEADEEALTREVREELSVDIIPESIKFYGVFRAQAHGKPLGTLVKMTCYTASFDGEPKASSEIEKIIWVTSKDLKTAPPVDKLILADLKKKNLIE